MKKEAGVLWMMLFACAAFPAQGADKTKDHGWLVGPIMTQSSNGRDFCSMKKTFGDVTFVLARDTADEDMVAFELSDKILRAGAPYPVHFQIDLLRRDMQGVAAAPNVLIAKMGDDVAFAESISEASRMQVAFAGKDQRFDLKGSRQAAELLVACVNWRKEGGAMPAHLSMRTENTDVAHSRVTKSKTVLQEFGAGAQARADVLQEEVDRLRAENRMLMLENQEAQKTLLSSEISADAKPKEKPVSKKEISFKDAVSDYMQGKKLGCNGDFAQQLAPMQKKDGLTYQAGEIVCLDSGADEAAALLFVNEGGKFKAIVHRGVPDAMLEALEKRDAALAELGK